MCLLTFDFNNIKPIKIICYNVHTFYSFVNSVMVYFVKKFNHIIEELMISKKLYRFFENILTKVKNRDIIMPMKHVGLVVIRRKGTDETVKCTQTLLKHLRSMDKSE